MINKAVEKAIEIALAAHQGQVDKANEPYILHPLRVMSKLDGENERVVGVLHDVVEDTDVTLSDLIEAGFNREVIAAIDALTRKTGETYNDYISRVLTNSLACVVKLVDLEDNLNRSIEDTEMQSELFARYEKAKMRLIKGV